MLCWIWRWLTLSRGVGITNILKSYRSYFSYLTIQTSVESAIVIQFRSTRRNLPTHIWWSISNLKVGFTIQSTKAVMHSIWRTYSSRYRLHLIMVSIETLVSKQDLPSCMVVLEGSTEILALLLQGSFQNILAILQYSHSVDVQYPEQTPYINSWCYLHSWYWYRW